LYSIYKKMQNKKISLNEMVDVYGFRIIVENADVCYRVLGLAHGVYKPMPGRFKDYIAIPRVNGYQSLHTTLFGPNGVPVEVQIRSEQMHRVAESGIAAHWKYKSGGDSFGGVEHDRAREWLASLVQIQEGGSSEEFLESVKVDLFPDKVYVFTPKGKILRLPTGATTVDFAYAIHTDVGNRCVAAKVDRRLVPLRTPLRNGQTVEIITAKGAKPNPSWSSFLVTAKARAAIRQYLKNLKKGDALELGRRLLGLALEEFSLSLKKIPAAQIDAVVKELNLRDADELYEKIGLGERLAPLVARRLQPADGEGESSHAHAGGPLMIAGTEGLLVTYARCCFPIPNDPIMAYLSAGRGVMIHRQNCGNLAEYRKQPDKWLSVAWESTRGRLFSSEIQLEINNRVGVLAAVASSIAGTETNIDQVSLEERDVNSSSLKFQVQVRDRKHLARVIRTVRRMPDVQRVFRTLA
jgi:GTP diphosphokinase / guanosine-3',5'-bis(diphosphate) 3'-diphosphatase